MRLIKKEGQITPKILSDKFGISGAAVTQWLKPLIEKGVLIWCDENGVGFTGIPELERAKRIGRAFVKVAERPCLPTPYQLTGDSRWDVGGEYWELYDLCIEESDPYVKDVGAYIHSDSDTRAGHHSETSGPDGGVKVLSEKTGSVDNFQKNGVDLELVPLSIEGLSDEFRNMQQIN